MKTMQLVKHKKAIFFAFVMLSFGMFALPLSAVSAADGAAGSIQASAQIFHVSGSPVSVNMYNLDVSSQYMLNWTGDATGISWTTSSTQTKFTHTFVLTSTVAVNFTLRAGAAGTVIDAVQITVVNLSSFLSTGLIISAGIFILIIVIFKRVAKG